MIWLAKLITVINMGVNFIAGFLLAPVEQLPGWISNTIISAVVGVFMLVIFKYTSNQKAICTVRDSIKANILALRLFKDSIAVTFASQGRLLKGAFLLLFHAIRPMAVMIIPVSLILAQMSLWYQYRPLRLNEKAVVTIEFNKPQALGRLTIHSIPHAEIITGPVTVPSKNSIYYEIKATKIADAPIVFDVDGEKIEKQLIIGDGFLRISSKKPGQDFSQILLYPAERPFAQDSPVKSIAIDYPERHSFASGSNSWVFYFCIASMFFAFIFKPILKVNI